MKDANRNPADAKHALRESVELTCPDCGKKSSHDATTYTMPAREHDFTEFDKPPRCPDPDCGCPLD